MSQKAPVYFYSGYGAKKNHQHTEKEFLSVMDKHFKKECPKYFAGNNCKDDKNCKEKVKFIFETALKINENPQYKMSKTEKQKWAKVKKECNKCIDQNVKKAPTCDADRYVEFSGANRKFAKGKHFTTMKHKKKPLAK